MASTTDSQPEKICLKPSNWKFDVSIFGFPHRKLNSVVASTVERHLQAEILIMKSGSKTLRTVFFHQGRNVKTLFIR